MLPLSHNAQEYIQAELCRRAGIEQPGGSAPNPVLTTLKYFREEYEAHVRNKKCPGHSCRKLITYAIDPQICVDKGHGCHVCAKNCPDGAIIGESKQVHTIDAVKCGKCGICYDVCKFDAISVE